MHRVQEGSVANNKAVGRVGSSMGHQYCKGSTERHCINDGDSLGFEKLEAGNDDE